MRKTNIGKLIIRTVLNIWHDSGPHTQKTFKFKIDSSNLFPKHLNKCINGNLLLPIKNIVIF